MSIELISAFGLGALVTAVFQAFFNIYQNKKALSFQEKKEAYIGLLQAYHTAAVNPSDDSSKNFAYWQMRCELISDIKVRKAIQDIVDTNEDRDKRSIAHKNLKSALRQDLGISV